MARSFNNAKLLSTLVLDGFSSTLIRRGYAATTTTQSAKLGGIVSMSSKTAHKSGEDKGANPYKVSWVPDPITGCYKPENIKEIDAADLRATLLGKKSNN
ncbi:hypothetical protein RIF29_24920 [Crotalaria pallida]|uniref:Late embryogenesis abundant protein n=1 Tax=Crotalaria pallida TaxID=3830 RepID=A0AAN9I3Q0_CROPI